MPEALEMELCFRSKVFNNGTEDDTNKPHLYVSHKIGLWESFMIGSKFSLLSMEAKANKPMQLANKKCTFFWRKSQTTQDSSESEVEENFDF